MNKDWVPGAAVVVVVDDESLIRTLVCRIFSSRRVVSFACAEEFAQAFDASEPHIIIVDKNMPGKSGLQLLEEHGKAAPAEFEAVLITGFADNDSALWAMRLGVSSYVRKPFRAEELVHAVNVAEQRLLLRLQLREAEQRLRQTEAQLSQARESRPALAEESAPGEVLAALREASADAATAAESSFVSRNERLLADVVHMLHGSLEALDSDEADTQRLGSGVQAAANSTAEPVAPSAESRSVTGQLERVRRLARDLESLAQEGGRSVVFDLREVVGIGERLLRPLVTKIGELQVAIPDAAVAVRGDRARLAQVVANVLINAAEAIEGRAGGQVALYLESRRERAVLTVIDNGAGIPVHQLEHVFDPFGGGEERARQSTGLAEAYDIITQHAGTITVESDVGAGTRITVDLPIATAPGTMYYGSLATSDARRG